LPPAVRKEKEEHYLIAKILIAVTWGDAYDSSFQDSKPSKNLLENAPPLVYWTAEHWDELCGLLCDLVQLIRAKQNGEYKNVLITIEMHQKLARLRKEVEGELSSKSSGPVNIDAKLVADFAYVI
jgi:hypothetical protein